MQLKGDGQTKPGEVQEDVVEHISGGCRAYHKELKPMKLFKLVGLMIFIIFTYVFNALSP